MVQSHSRPITFARNGLLFALVVVALSGLLTPEIRAITFGSGEKVQYSALHRVDGDLLVAASKVITEGTIDGDLIASGYLVTNSGEVTGSIIVSAYEFRHRGIAGGSVRSIGFSSEIDGFVERSVMAFGSEITIGGRAVIRRDLFVRGGNIAIGGTIMGNADVEAEKIEITGQIDGDAKLVAAKITILPPAVISGNLTYNADAELEIDTLGGVTILGHTMAVEPDDDDQDEENAITRIILFTAELLGAFLFGAILILVFKRQAKETCRQMQRRFSVAAAAGVVTIVISLLSLFILLCSLAAALIGFSMVPGDSAHIGAILIIFATIMVPITAFASVAGGVLFYSGAIVISVALGFVIVRLFRAEPAALSKTQLLIGLFVTFLLFELPYAGPILFVLAGIVGAGGIVLGVRHCHHSIPPVEPLNDSTPSPPDLPSSTK